MSIAVAHLDSGDPRLPLLQVRTDRLTATFLPGAGGRLLSLVGHDGVERLWRSSQVFDGFRVVHPRANWPVIDGTFASWTNLGGSKTWPAPQGWGGPGQWPGPPDPVLDAGQWQASIAERGQSVHVSLLSPVDSRTGLQITRSFQFTGGADRFAQVVEFRNTVDRAVTWAIWEVAQVPVAPGDEVHVASRDGTWVDLGAYRGGLKPAFDSRSGTLRVPVTDAVAKLGVPTGLGTIGLPGRLRLEFPVFPDSTYPDEGSRAEVWMQYPTPSPIEELSGLHPDSYLVELEVLGPLETLAPGGTSSLSITWVLE